MDKRKLSETDICDRAQASKQNRNELQQKLRRSAIHTLETAETEEDFNKSWYFVRDNFSAVTESPNIVYSLKKLLLNLAVNGFKLLISMVFNYSS